MSPGKDPLKKDCHSSAIHQNHRVFCDAQKTLEIRGIQWSVSGFIWSMCSLVHTAHDFDQRQRMVSIYMYKDQWGSFIHDKKKKIKTKARKWLLCFILGEKLKGRDIQDVKSRRCSCLFQLCHPPLFKKKEVVVPRNKPWTLQQAAAV